MSFSYTGSAEAMASQTLPWGIALIVAGLGFIIYRIRRDKSYVYMLAGIAFALAGSWISYQAVLLKRHPGDWNIRVDEHRIVWESPHDAVDPSFELELADIDHILVERWIDASELRARYTIVTGGGSIALRPISGVNLDEFTRALVSVGVAMQTVEIDKPK